MSRILVLTQADLGAALLSPDAYPDLAYTSAITNTRYWAPDTISVTFSGAARGASAVVNKALLWMPDDGDALYLVEQVETQKTGASRVNSTITATGRAIEGVATQERLVIPSGDYDEQTAVPAETAIKHYVLNHAAGGAAAARRIANMAVASDLASGTTVTVQARYQYVHDIIYQIGLLAGMGWKTALDRATGIVVFDTVLGVDRSASVFFDFDFGTVTGWQDVDSILTSKTVAVVAGQGDLAARDIETRWTGGEPTGLDRREALVDARDVAVGDTATLDTRGDAFLTANQGTRSNSATISNFGSFQPGVDWNVGDIVLLRDSDAGVSEASRVLELKRTWKDSAAVPTMEAVVGKPEQSVTSVIGGGFGPDGSAVDAGITHDAVEVIVAAAVAPLLVADTTPPGVPTGLALASDVVLNSDGGSYVRLQASLVQPVAADLYGTYVEVTSQNDGADSPSPVWDRPEQRLIPAGETSTRVDNVQGVTNFWARARSVDLQGNFSAFCATVTILTVGDTTAPPTPNTPTVTSAFRGFGAFWTGGDAVDLARYEVRWAANPSAAPDGDPGAWTTVQAKANVVFVGALDPDIKYWVEVRGVDLSGNSSAWSAAASVTPTKIGAGDVAFNSVLTAILAANAVDATTISTGTLRIRDAAGYAAGIEIFTSAGILVGSWDWNGLKIMDPANTARYMVLDSGVIKFTQDNGATFVTALTPAGLSASAILFGSQQGGHNLVLNSSFEMSAFVAAATLAVFTDNAGTPAWKAANRTTAPVNTTEGAADLQVAALAY